MNHFPHYSTRFLAACLLFALQIVACGGSANDLVARGNAAYAEGRFDEALILYDEASVTVPESPGIHFNRGTVHYRMEDYASAADAFKEAAIRAKDPALSSQAKYNLGNCAFRNAQRQRDSDLKKAIEHCEESIAHYQEARDLNPDYLKAAENIEIVRLYVKVLLDEQKKKQEQQEQQQEQEENLVEKLKKLIERQNELMTQNESLRVARPLATDATAQETWTKALEQLTNDEGVLHKDTGAVLVEMRQTVEQIRQQAAAGGAPGAQGGPPQPTPPEATAFAEKVEVASGHVGNAMADEQLAENALAATQQKTAHTHQTNAVADLEEAVKALADDQQQQDQQQQQQQDGDQNQDQQDQEQQDQEQQQDQQDQEQNEENQEQQDNQEQQQSQDENSEEQQQEQQEAQARAEQADDILDEEKENQKQRQPTRPGRVKPVDRDW